MLTTLNPNCGRDGAAPKTATTMFKRGKAAAAGLLPSSLRYKRRALKSSVAALQQVKPIFKQLKLWKTHTKISENV